MARLPEARAIFGLSGPIKGATVKLARDLTETLRLFLDARRTAMELQKKHRRLRQSEPGIGIAGLHLQSIKEFDACDRYARLDGPDGSLAARLHRRERTDARCDRFGHTGKFQSEFDNDSTRSFRSDDQ